MDEVNWRKIFGQAVLAACGLALLIGLILILGGSRGSFKFAGWILFGYAAVVFTLFGFFSAMMEKKSPLVAKIGMVASAVSLLFSLVMVMDFSAIGSEFVVRLATLAFVTSIGLGYVNLLQSIKQPGNEIQSKLIDYASLAAVVVVAFAVLGVSGVKLTSGFIYKFLSLCSLSAVLGGISAYVLGRMDETDSSEYEEKPAGLDLGGR